MVDDLPEIITGCQVGNRAAQRQLYDRFGRMVYRMAVRLVGKTDAADVTQEVFLRVFAGIGGFRAKAEFTTWLYRVATNECLRHQGRQSRQLKPLAEEPICGATGPDRLVEQADLLERALHQLNSSLRAVFLLREVEGLSYQQIAEVLRIAPGTVASQLSRARAGLQAFLRHVEQGLT
jgi:RNA polymerase sigma-70 factor (ECF subfamily)